MNFQQFLTPDILFLIVLAIVPSAIWFYFFYKKDPSPVPLKNLILTFFVGCFSVVPLFTYQTIYRDYAYEKIFEVYLMELAPSMFIENYIANLALQGFISFFSAILFLAVLISVLSALLTIVLTFFYKQTFKNVWHALIIETTNFTAFGVIIALIISVEVVISSYVDRNIVTSTLGLFMVLAVMEEYVKHLMVRFTDDHRIRDIDDAIEMSLVVGLAFAFVENIVYFVNYRDQIWTIFVGRSVFSLFAHILFSGIFGFYYGTAHFAKYIYFLRARVHGQVFQLPRFVHKILHLKGHVTYHEQKLMEGLVLATVIHTIFNLLLEFNWTIAIVPFLLIGYFFLSYLLSHKENQKQYGLVGSRAMPYNDYQRLTWKISTIRWAEQIKRERELKEVVSNKQ